jgi:signal transduction histidine kinase
MSYGNENGTGRSRKATEKDFQRFFTTKPSGEETGSGLSLSYDIVKAHDGELKVETTDGQYSTFIVSIPANKQEEVPIMTGEK